MRITLIDANGEFSIYFHNDFETLDEYIELLIKPVLRATGFCEPLLDKYFVKEAPISFADGKVELSPAAEKKSAKKYWE